MRRYNIVSGIFLILSIIDSALAAPVLVQEKRQACVDVVHIPRYAISVLGKRGKEELDELARVAEEYFKTGRRPVESSDAHASLNSAPPGPGRGSTNVAQVPAPNPASSTANPSPLMEPTSPSSTASSDLSGSDSEYLDLLYEFDDLPMTEAHASAPQPNPKKRPWTDLDPESTGEHALQPNPKKMPPTGPDPNFDWMNLGDRLPPRPAWLKEPGQANDQVEHVQRPDPGPSMSAGLPTVPAHQLVIPPSTNPGLNKEPEYDVFHGLPPTPVLTDPELHLDHQSLSTDSQPVDLLAAIYAAKGKAKESRRISGTTRDVEDAKGNAVQRELQPKSAVT